MSDQDKEPSKPPAKRPRNLFPWENACLSSIKSSDMSQCKRIKARLECLLSKANGKIDMLHKIEEMMDDDGGLESDAGASLPVAVPASARAVKTYPPAAAPTNPDPGHCNFVDIPTSAAREVISYSITDEGQLYNIRWAVYSPSDQGANFGAKKFRDLLAPITPSPLEMVFGNRTVLERFKHSEPVAAQRKDKKRPHLFIAYQTGNCSSKGCKTTWALGFTHQAIMDMVNGAEVVKLGLYVDMKCQHESRHNKKLGQLLCADESLLLGNESTAEQIGDEDDADHNIHELVLRKRVYTAFYKASILSIIRQWSILKALAAKMDSNKFMSHSLYAEWMSGSRKAQRPLKVEYCVVLNAFVSLVDQDRMDEIKELVDSLENRKLARDD